MAVGDFFIAYARNSSSLAKALCLSLFENKFLRSMVLHIEIRRLVIRTNRLVEGVD